MVSYTFTDSDDNNPMGRYLDPFDLDLDWGTSSGERRHAVVASGSVLLPLDITVGDAVDATHAAAVVRDRRPRPEHDGFNTDLVPGTTRNSGIART